MTATTPIGTIILDFDGTLADTRPLIVTTMQQVIGALHLEPRTNEQCAAMIGLPLKECFTRLIAMPDELGEQCALLYRQYFEENKARGMRPVPFPHVAETLAALHRRGMTLTIASSRNHQSLQEFLDAFGFASYFALVLGADDTQHAKPHPEPVLTTLERLNASPAQALVVGDATFDIAMGRAAGCSTCGVTYGNHTRQQLREAGADHIIDDFGELASLL